MRNNAERALYSRFKAETGAAGMPCNCGAYNGQHSPDCGYEQGRENLWDHFADWKYERLEDDMVKVVKDALDDMTAARSKLTISQYICEAYQIPKDNNTYRSAIKIVILNNTY